jgi:hypothetical protein
MLIATAGTAYWLWRFKDDRHSSGLILGLPVAAVGLWAVYLRIRIASEAGLGQIQGIGFAIRWIG